MVSVTILYVCRFKLEKDTNYLNEEDRLKLNNLLFEGAKNLKESRCISFDENYGTIDLITSLSYGELNVSSMATSFIQNGNIIFVHEKESTTEVIYLDCYEGFFGLFSDKDNDKFFYIYYEKDQSIVIANKITAFLNAPSLSRKADRSIKKMKLPDCMPPPPPPPPDDVTSKSQTLDNRAILHNDLADQKPPIKDETSTTTTPTTPFYPQKKPRKKLTKADIGKPSDFRHVQHYGMNETPSNDDCFDNQFQSADNIIDASPTSNNTSEPQEPSSHLKHTARPKSLGADSILGRGLSKRNPMLALISSPGRNKYVQKIDIGLPTDFQHKDHIGCNESFFKDTEQEKYVGEYLEGIGLECLIKKRPDNTEENEQNGQSTNNNDNPANQSDPLREIQSGLDIDKNVEKVQDEDDASNNKEERDEVEVMFREYNNKCDPLSELQNNEETDKSSLNNQDHLLTKQPEQTIYQENVADTQENLHENKFGNFSNVDLEQYNMSLF